MKTRLIAVTVALGIAIAAGGLALGSAPAAVAKGAAGNNFATQLSGQHEVPPKDTPAHGTAHFHVSKDASTVSYKVVVNKLTGSLTGAHIHRAEAGVNGPVVVSLLAGAAVTTNKNTTVISGSFPMSAYPLFVEEADEGWLYVNVHTTVHPSGQVRGQLS